MDKVLQLIVEYANGRFGWHIALPPDGVASRIALLAVTVLAGLVVLAIYVAAGEKRAWRKSFSLFWRTLSQAVTNPTKALEGLSADLRQAIKDVFGDTGEGRNATALRNAVAEAIWTHARPLRRGARDRVELGAIDAAFEHAGQSALSITEIAAHYPDTAAMSKVFIERARTGASNAYVFEKIRPALERVYPEMISNEIVKREIGAHITAQVRDSAKRTEKKLGDIARRIELRSRLRLARYTEINDDQIANLPTRMVVADHNIVEYADITDLAATTLAWARTGDGVLGKLIIGGGGFGKSRLAMHVANTLNAEGWQYSGFLSRAELRRPNALNEFPVMITDDTRGVFLVLDYAETRIDEIRQVVRAAIAAQAEPDARPVRFLLLARLAGVREKDGWRHAQGDWWQSLLDDTAADTAPERQVFARMPLFAESANTVPVDQRRGFVDRASAAFEKRLQAPALKHLIAPPDQRRPIPADRLNSDASGNPLMLTFEAFLHVRGAAMEGSPLAEMAREESKHWLRSLGGDAPSMGAKLALSMQRAVAYQTMVQDFDLVDAELVSREAVKSAYSTADDPREMARSEQKVQATLRNLYGDAALAKLRPVQPDLLGEHVVGEALAVDRSFLARILLGSVAAGTKERARNIFTVLNRATKPVHDSERVITPVMAALLDALPDCFGSFADQIVEAALAEDGRLQEAARLAMPAQPDGIRENTAGLLLRAATRRVDANAAPARMRAFLADAAAIAAGHKDDRPGLSETKSDDLFLNATSADAQAVLLANAGRYDEASAAGSWALSAYAELQKRDPQAYRLHYAAALGNRSKQAFDLGHPETALPLQQESVRLLREGLAVDRPAYLAILAMALSNLSAQSAALGRGAEAATAGKEAVTLYQELAHADRAEHGGNLAMSMSTYANALWLDKKQAEAMACMRDAVAKRRELVAENPDAYLAHLATSLNNYAAIAWAGAQYEESMTSSSEAIELRFQLAAVSPEVYGAALRNSIENRLRLSQSKIPETAAPNAYLDGARGLLPFARRHPELHNEALHVLLSKYVDAARTAGQSTDQIDATLGQLGLRIDSTPLEPNPEALALGVRWQDAHATWAEAPNSETAAAARAAFQVLSAFLESHRDDPSVAPLVIATERIMKKIVDNGPNPYAADPT